MTTLPHVPIADKVLLSLVEAAALCGCSDDTLRAEVDSGRLPHMRLNSRRMIPRAGLDAWIARRAAQDTAQAAAAPPTKMRRRSA